MCGGRPGRRRPPCRGPAVEPSVPRVGGGGLGPRWVSAPWGRFRVRGPRAAGGHPRVVAHTGNSIRGREAAARGGSGVRAATWECSLPESVPRGRGAPPPPGRGRAEAESVAPGGSRRVRGAAAPSPRRSPAGAARAQGLHPSPGPGAVTLTRVSRRPLPGLRGQGWRRPCQVRRVPALAGRAEARGREDAASAGPEGGGTQCRHPRPPPGPRAPSRPRSAIPAPGPRAARGRRPRRRAPKGGGKEAERRAPRDPDSDAASWWGGAPAASLPGPAPPPRAPPATAARPALPSRPAGGGRR